jgi:hypothetical protein
MVYETNIKSKHESAPESDNGEKRSKDSVLNFNKFSNSGDNSYRDVSNDQKVMNEVEKQIVNQKDNTNFIGSTLFENDKGGNNQVKQISLKESHENSKNIEIRKDLRAEFSHHNRFKHPLLQGSEEDRKYPFGSEIMNNAEMTPIESKNERKSLSEPQYTLGYEENFNNQWYKSILFNKGGLSHFDDKRRSYANLFESKSMKFNEDDFDSKPDNDTKSQGQEKYLMYYENYDAFPPLKRDRINEPRNESTNFSNKQSKQSSDSTHSANTSADNNNQGQNRKSDLESQPSSMNAWFPNVINRWMPASSNKNENETKVIFHVHLPEDIAKIGKPIILGNIEELGLWKKPVVKLHQPYPQSKTYWQSDLVTISLSSLINREIQYKYAIHVTKSIFNGREEKILHEGNGSQDNRILNIERNDQFDIWKNNDQLPHLGDIRDFVFVDYIYNSIKASNLKNKVMDYQHILSLYSGFTIRDSNLHFITKRIDDNDNFKRLFLCLLLGYYTIWIRDFQLPDKFPSELLLYALEEYKQNILPSNTKDQMYIAIVTLVQHNALHMRFEWLNIFTIAAEVDPRYAFIDHLKFLKYSNDNLLADFIKEVKIIKPYIEHIKPENYVKIAKVIF